MKFSVLAENLKELKEALKSKCQSIRYGSEYCANKLPSLAELKEAYQLTSEVDKEFVYLTPRANNQTMETLATHLDFLSQVAQKEIKVTINDIGLLELVKNANLPCILGRQLIAIPARCRPKMSDILKKEEGAMVGFVANKIFTKTNLDYDPTVEFFKVQGISHIEIDWLPECFGELAKLVKNGILISVHSHLSVVTCTRECHTARFLGLADQKPCSHPCFNKVFVLQQKLLGDLYLKGNIVCTLEEPQSKNLNTLKKVKAAEIVLNMSILTKLTNTQEINNAISKYSV